MNRFYDTLKVVGVLALAGLHACGAGQSNVRQLPSRYSTENWVEGIHRDKNGEVYAIGCIDYHPNTPNDFQENFADMEARTILTRAENESRVSEENVTSKINGRASSASRSSDAVSGRLRGTKNTGYTIRDGEICSRMEKFSF